MTVTEENIEARARRITAKKITERSYARACIENENLIATANLNARRVTAVTRCIWAGAGGAPAHTPKPDGHGAC
jgi:hypothetical protein